MGNANSHPHEIEIDREIESLPQLDRSLLPGDYFIVQIRYQCPHRGLVNSPIREFPKEHFFLDAPHAILNMFSGHIPVPYYVANRAMQKIVAFATAAGPHHDFAASRLLPINVGIFRTPTNNSLSTQHSRAIEHGLRGSVEAFPRTIPATKESVEALEEVQILECDNNQDCCVICLEELSRPCSSAQPSSGHDDEDNDQQKALKLPCSHLFHEGCIVKWLQNSHLCPLCRYAMPTFYDH